MQQTLNNITAPGTTITLNGDYEGSYTSTLAGTAENPIVIDAYGARINGWLWLKSSGEHVIVEGLETRCLDWVTRDIDDDAEPNEFPFDDFADRASIRLDMPNAELRRCKIHNDYIGVGGWGPATGFKVNECHIYHNGWYNPVGADFHGEGMYVQGETGTRVIQACVAHDNFDHNIVLYSTVAALKNFQLIDNVLFNDEFTIGGQTAIENILLQGNQVKASIPTGLGFGSVANVSLTAQNNTFAQITSTYYQGLIVRKFASLTMTGNTIAMPQCTYPVYLTAPPALWSDWTWDNNTYYVTQNPWQSGTGPWFYAEGYGDVVKAGTNPVTGGPWLGLSFEDWKSLTGYDANSTLVMTLPPDSIHVRLSAYANAATFTIWNWSQAGSQNVDLGALPHGNYRAFNAQNLDEYFDFEWEGTPVSFAMTDWTNGIPIGHDEALEPVSFPSFGVFLVEER